MSTNLKTYFPMLWDRLELLEEIKKHSELYATFYKGSIEQQERFFISFIKNERKSKSCSTE